MSTIAELLVTLGMNTAGFKTGTQDAAQSLGKLEKSFKTIEDAGKKISNVGKSITLGITTPVIAAGGALVSFASSAQSAMQVEDAFNAVSKTAGVMGDKMLQAMQKSSKGLISNVGLMKNFNLAASLVGTNFAVKLPEAFEYLGKVSAATGQSMDYMLDSLVRGVGRLSPLILDNLGIQVDLTEAYEAYAKEVGKSVEELSKQEQQTAVLNMTMQKLQQNTAAMSGEFGSATGSIKTAMENAKVAIGKELVPALAEASAALVPVIEKFSKLFEEGGSLHPVITAVGDSLMKLVDGAGKVVDAVGQLDPDKVKRFTDKLLVLAALGPGLTIVGKAVSGVGSTLGTLTKALTGIGSLFGVVGTSATLMGGLVVAAFAAMAVAAWAFYKEAEKGQKQYAERMAVMREIDKALIDEAITLEQHTQIMADLDRGFITAGEALGRLPGKFTENTDAVRDNIEQMLIASDSYEGFKRSLAAANIELPLMTEEIWNEVKANQAAGLAIDGSAASTDDLGDALTTTTEKVAKMTTGMWLAAVAAGEYSSKIGFIAGNLDFYSSKLSELTLLEEQFAAMPTWKQKTEEGKALQLQIAALGEEFDNMIAKANAQTLYDAIMGDGVATEKEFRTYLDYLEKTGLATKDQTTKMMQDWKAMNDFQNSLRYDYEGNVYIIDEATPTLEEIIEKIKGIERKVGITIDVTAMGAVNLLGVRDLLRAEGGPVTAGMPYIVGERGSELFVPQTDGYIVPHHEVSSYEYSGNDSSQPSVENNYYLTMPTTANPNNVVTAFKIMEALG